MDVKFNYFLLEIFMHLHYYVEGENGMILEVSGNKAIFVLVCESYGYAPLMLSSSPHMLRKYIMDIYQ